LVSMEGSAPRLYIGRISKTLIRDFPQAGSAVETCARSAPLRRGRRWLGARRGLGGDGSALVVFLVLPCLLPDQHHGDDHSDRRHGLTDRPASAGWRTPLVVHAQEHRLGEPKLSGFGRSRET
jgi:hypothetical protein